MTAARAKALADAAVAARDAAKAEARLNSAIRKCAKLGASRAETAEAVGLSKTSVQRIIVTGANR